MTMMMTCEFDHIVQKKREAKRYNKSKETFILTTSTFIDFYASLVLYWLLAIQSLRHQELEGNIQQTVA